MASKKNQPSLFATLQKTTESAAAVNGEFTRQLSLTALVDNPLNRFSMAEDEQFESTLASVERDGFLDDIIVINHRRRCHTCIKSFKSSSFFSFYNPSAYIFSSNA